MPTPEDAEYWNDRIDEKGNIRLGNKPPQRMDREELITHCIFLASVLDELPDKIRKTRPKVSGHLATVYTLFGLNVAAQVVEKEGGKQP